MTGPGSAGLRQRAGRALVWASIGWFSTTVLTFLVTVATTRLLAPDRFGLVTLILVIVQIGAIFTDAGTRAALIQRADPIEDAVSTALIAVPLAGAVGSGMVAASSWLVAGFYGEPELTALTLALSGWLFLFSLSIVPDALLQRRFDLRLRRGVIDPLAMVLYGATVIVLALLGAEEWSLIVGQYVHVLTITGGAWALARPRFRDGRPSFATWQSLRRYGRYLLAANLLRAGDNQGPSVALGRNLGPADVGFWGAGLRLARLPTSGITNVVGQAFFPALSRLQSDAARFRARTLEAITMLSLVLVPVSVGVICLAEPLVVILFGERWRPAGQALQILGVWCLGQSLTDAGHEVLKASGRTRAVARIAGAQSVTVLAFLALLWALGAVSLLAVAAGVSLSAAVALAATALALGRGVGIGLSTLWEAIRPAALGGVVQGVVVSALVVLAVPGFEHWRRIGGLEVGLLAPLVMLAVLAVVSAVVYVAAVEVVAPRTVGRLVRSVRTIVRPGRSAPVPPSDRPGAPEADPSSMTRRGPTETTPHETRSDDDEHHPPAHASEPTRRATRGHRRR